MSADGNGRVDSRISIFVSLDKQLTEREWRRPLTWLDRFRDAVLLPASWGDENIQPHVGNKYLQFAFCKKKSKQKKKHVLPAKSSKMRTASAIESWQKVQKVILE